MVVAPDASIDTLVTSTGVATVNYHRISVPGALVCAGVQMFNAFGVLPGCSLYVTQVGFDPILPHAVLDQGTLRADEDLAWTGRLPVPDSFFVAFKYRGTSIATQVRIYWAVETP